MKLDGARVLLTGAGGGIGTAIAEALVGAGAKVLLTSRRATSLDVLQSRLHVSEDTIECVSADLTDASGRAYLAGIARKWHGGIDVLINNAGDADFSLLQDQSEMRIAQLVQLNVLAPMLLTRALLPSLETRSEACVLNVGSILGHIGHPGYAVYCASKAALAAFSEALQRECAGGAVRVLYVAPRATQTALNSDAAVRMNEALGSVSDPPERVAHAVLAALEGNRSRTFVGWPEKLFVRLNALLPRLVDRDFRSKIHLVREHATSARPTTP